jgi:alkanesulfonate monooxygenase SsuD/methylene tetrahydromethanopterin reductase-like flavin-dependent oxidoreductase (luciferase family)
LLRSPRTTGKGTYFELNDAPNQPAPVQTKLPLLIGGGGEKRTLRIAAQYADEWNAWTTPDVLAHKVSVLHRHCDDIGRDPSEIEVSTQAMVFLSRDEEWLAKHRGDADRPVVVGTPEEVVDILGAYRDAGVDEFIVPDWTFGRLSRRKETVDMFIEDVAPALR